MTRDKVRIRYLSNDGFKWTRRMLREDVNGLFVKINGNKCYVEPLRFKDTGKIIHYVSRYFDYK